MRILKGVTRRTALALPMAAAFLHHAEAQAKDVGRVSKIAGTASVLQADGRTTAAVPGMVMHPGDKVTTGAGGRLEILCADGTTITIGDRTMVTLSRIVTPQGAQPGSGLLDLLEGILRLELPGSWNSFDVMTGTAVASVRSTRWLIQASPDDTAVFVRQGRVEVANIARTGGVMLYPGFGTDVKTGAPPTLPKRWGQPRIDAALARTAIG